MIKALHLEKAVPVGYAGLINLFKLEVLPHYRKSYILAQGTPFAELENHIETHYYRKKNFLKDFQDPLGHLEFALRHEGINLEILAASFPLIADFIIEDYVRKQPTSKLARKIWYLYEFLTNKILNLENAEGGSYTLLLDPEEYYTAEPSRSRRHYIDDNMLGNKNFCPFIRKTPTLKKFEEKQLSQVANQLIEKYDPLIIARATNYLYVKETMSSYEIEREKPNSSRTQRFVEALKQADHIGELSKQTLIDLQNMIVDPRYANADYRTFQNYIGSNPRLDLNRSIIDYIPPKPEQVASMMQGLLDSLEKMIAARVHSVVLAACVAFGFVFIHPFEDGNGRIHRFLMHYIFARTKFVPIGAIFPVSAVILKEINQYDALLETFSKPLSKVIKNYEIDKKGELTVKDETDNYYRYLDYTRFAEHLFNWVEKTISTDLKTELNYIVNYDITKKAMQEIVDMPDKKLNLLIQLVLQNHGSLAAKKRIDHFSMLNDHEVHQLEAIIQANMHTDQKG